MKQKITEKVVNKYVIATLSSPTKYLVSLHWGRWALTESIEAATKTYSRKLAESVLSNYLTDVDQDAEMVVLPIEIEYSFLCEESAIDDWKW